MSRQILDYDDGYPLLVNTFWMGGQEGVQFTEAYGQNGYVQMTRAEAMLFLKEALRKLEEQCESDKEKPPWWQEMNKVTQ